MATRRDFLKALVGALGGAILSSCGSSGGKSGQGKPVPNGYKFYTVMKSGDVLSEGNTADSFPGVAMINDSSEIAFYAYDNAGALGAYKFAVDFDSPVPALQNIRKVVRQGDLIKNEEVSRLNVGSFNNSGWHASILDMKSGLCGVYLHRDHTGIAPSVLPLDSIPGIKSSNKEYFQGKFMDLDLDDRNSMLVSASFSTNQESVPQEGIFVLPEGEVSDKGNLLQQEGIELPGGEETTEGFGLIDIAGKDGNYVSQVYVDDTEPTLQASKAIAGHRPRKTAVLTGNIYDPDIRPRTISASANTSLIKKYGSSAKVVSGESYYGPRAGNSGAIAHVIHKTDDIVALFLDNKEIITTVGTTPLGNVAKGLGCPVVGDDGLIYIVVFTTIGEELCIYNGSALTTVLATGDFIAQPGPGVGSIIFGTVPDMVNQKGRIVFFVQYEDRSRALVVGIPH